MIYYLIKILIQLYNRIYFRKIHIYGSEIIPENKPVFLASNHPNGFLDGTIVSSSIARPTYVFVRGDVFNRKWSNFLLRRMFLLPIYRVRDGEVRQSVEENNRSYNQLHSLFQRNKLVMIFPESDSIPVKRLRRLKNGTARITSDMESRNSMDIPISVIPTGLNYSFFGGFGKELFMQFSGAIYLNDSSKHTSSLSETIQTFTKKLHQKIHALVIHVSKGTEDVAEIGFKLIRASLPINFRFIQRDQTSFSLHYKLAEKLGNDDIGSFHRQIINYWDAIRAEALPQKTIMPGFLKLSISFILFIPTFISWIPMWLITQLAILVVNRTVKLPQFHDSVIYGIGATLSMLADVAGTILCAIYAGWQGAIIYVIARWLSIFFYDCLDHLRRLKSELIWKRFKKRHPDKFIELMQQRSQILDRLTS